MKGFSQRILQEIMKKNNTWNIRRLVDDSFVPSFKQPSVLYCKLTDFLICFRDSLTFRIECGVTNQSSSIIDFQWFPLCIKINAVCLVMHYANWLIESQVWELLFNLAFQLIIELESSTER